MTTFRELEAFIAVIDMGSFKGAAKSMNTSQSAISRLIREFEAGFDQPLFDRGKRSSEVTMTGMEVLHVARAIIHQRNKLRDRFSEKSSAVPSLRLGVTELATFTWLSKFIKNLKSVFSTIQIDIETGSSAYIYTQIRANKLDIAVVSDTVRSQEMIRINAHSVLFGWYCSKDYQSEYDLSEESASLKTLIIQSATTSSGRILSTYLSDNNIRPKDLIQCDSLQGVLSMAKESIGIACIPKSVAEKFVKKSILKEVFFSNSLMVMKYVILVKVDEITPFYRAVISEIENNCKTVD